MQSTISGFLIKARQVDAARAGQRDRALLEVRRARRTGHPHAGGTGLAHSLARLLLRRSVRRAAAQAIISN